MGIKYYYNFCASALDDADMGSDILSAVRRSYFNDYDKIRDRITVDSAGESLSYEYDIEKDKPLRWIVRDGAGRIVQEVKPAENGRYYLCCYRREALFKRLLFSKLHTLLRVEYTDGTGAVCCAVEPRKVNGEVRLLYTAKELSEPLILTQMPEVSGTGYDVRITEMVQREFPDNTVVASTNEGVVRFLSDEQLARYQAFVEKCRLELSQETEESFIGEDAPLYHKINAKDFNVKRNLSSSLDITKAQDFDAEASSEPVEQTEELTETVETENETTPEIAEAVEETVEEISEETETAIKPDKLIMADGAQYSYYGPLDENGNRSGFGRTLTDLGRTAYEGEYINDKRSGKGAYYYKDGSLCYSGEWAENVRHGIGVGVSARDGSIHVGRFVNNKPEGNGVRVSADGSVKFVCKQLENGSTVLMNYLPDDTVLISRYDAKGRKIGEKTISLSD